MILLYNFLMFLLLLFSPPIILITVIFSKSFRRDFFDSFKRDFSERFAVRKFPAKIPGKKRILIHCSSVGEFNATYPLILQLQKAAEVIVSVHSATGKTIALQKLKENVRSFPIDFYPFQKRFLKQVSPDLIIIIETELWPGFISAASNLGIKIVSVNSVLSEDRIESYLRLKGLYSKVLGKIDRFFAASKEDLTRLKKLVKEDSKLELSGNIKFDGIVSENVNKEEIIREYFSGIEDGLKPFIITLGSIRQKEDRLILNSLKRLIFDLDLSLIIAPRHLDKLKRLCHYLDLEKFEYYMMSEKPMLKKRAVYVVDSIGHLKKFYSISNVTFVGGTMVPIGGHNILEPIAYGKPVLFGKYTAKVKSISEQLIHAGIGFRVSDVKELTKIIKQFIDNPDELKSIEEKAISFINKNRGIVLKISEEIIGKYL